VLESSPDCIKVLNSAGEITFINLNGICILEGESKDQFMGRPWVSMWESYNQPVVADAVAKAFRGEISEFIALSPTVKGTPKWWNVQVKPILAADGKVMSALATSRDITSDKNRELALKASEQKFRLLADSMPQFVWTGDAAGKMDYFDQSVFEYSGLTLTELQQDGWAKMVHLADAEANMLAWQHSIATGDDFRFEHRLKKFDGSFRWHLSRATPKRDDNGVIQMWVGTSTDIEDQKTFANELERLVHERTKELAESNFQLAKMNKELESFAYISSHDLQEPLRKIQTFANQILEKEAERLSEFGKDKFQRMQNAAMRMQTLIEDLLNYSRTTNSKKVFENTDLNHLLTEVKEELKEELAHKNAVIETDGLCNANIIPFQFRQLLYNLLRNSLKFAAAHRSSVIKIGSKQVPGAVLSHPELDKAQRYCHITVSDNGIGFEQAYSQKIFEVFQKLHTRKEYEGTGIGLAIVKKIVDNHHGVIEANGLAGEGARFDIYLPVSED
ncbi:MAG: PAS domain-containing sensor histidine kinase, partial [Chitinophagaceae bacterium]